MLGSCGFFWLQSIWTQLYGFITTRLDYDNAIYCGAAPEKF